MYNWQGVRQGRSLPPLPYLIYDEAMITEATETVISVGGRIINTIRYADDKAVVASSQRGLQQLMDNLNKVTREFGMKINVKKKVDVHCTKYISSRIEMGK